MIVIVEPLLQRVAYKVHIPKGTQLPENRRVQYNSSIKAFRLLSELKYNYFTGMLVNYLQTPHGQR